nr:mast cell protease 2-like [Chrysemys picta bellii]
MGVWRRYKISHGAAGGSGWRRAWTRTEELRDGAAPVPSVVPAVLPLSPCWDISVILGAHNYRIPEASQQMFEVESYRPHPEYDSRYVPYNDILLLKLSHKAKLNKYVQVIPLPKTNSDIPTDTKCIVSGWGYIDQEVATYKLFETNATALSRRKCLQFYPELSDGMVCAASYHKLSDVNYGESSGPLVCNGVAQGVVSYGFQFPPSVYTRVTHYLPWIRKTMGQ